MLIITVYKTTQCLFMNASQVMDIVKEGSKQINVKLIALLQLKKKYRTLKVKISCPNLTPREYKSTIRNLCVKSAGVSSSF